MSKEAYMSVSWGKRTTKLDKSTILYAIANRKYVEVHVNKDYVFKTSASFMVVKEQLAEGFIEVKRGLVVSERAIDYIADTIRLVNGEELDYTIRRKREIVEKLRQNKKLQIVMTKRGIYQIANQGEMPVLNLAAHNIMNPAGSNMPRRIRVSRKTELDRIRKLLAAKNPEPEETPEPCICFRFHKQEYKIAISTILYATMQKGIIYIHTVDGTIYRERTSLRIMEEQLGDSFLKINISTLVAVRYGNPALAKLEKLPLHVLIGSAFGDLFYNMDSKWLESYERAALYGETLEVLDYSPEIDTNLKVICFQTFVGHCGCILFNVDEMK